MYINDLIPGLNLEDYETEFKGIIGEGENPKDGKERIEFGWLKTIASFANTNGGSLFVGVEDKTHKIVSLDHKTFDRIVLMVQRLILRHIEPKIDYRIVHHDVREGEQTRYVMEIRVERSPYLPVVLHFHEMGMIFVRRFGECGLATSQEIRNLVLQSAKVSYDDVFTSERYCPEDFTCLRNKYAEKNNGKELTEKALISIGFMDNSLHLSKGALLFKDDYCGPLTLMEMIQFRSHSKGDNRFFASERINENIIASIEKAISFVTSHSANGYEKTPDGRKSFIAYPPRAVEEAIVNAFAHRDYFIDGGQIEVNVFIDRLQIVSPGSYLGGALLNREYHIDTLPPRRRNEVICGVLHLCRLMERQGSGFDNIHDDYLPYGERYRPFADSTSSSFSITLPDLTYAGGPVFLQESVALSPLPLIEDKYSMRILSYCFNQSRSVSEIAAYLGISVSTHLKKNILERLVKDGYLVESGGYPMKYRTNQRSVTLA